jgi:hypothetical protein
METAAQDKRRRGINLPWVLVLILAAFVGGFYVGQNPSWIPFPLPQSVGPIGGDENPGFHPLNPHPATQPASQPTETPATHPALR